MSTFSYEVVPPMQTQIPATIEDQITRYFNTHEEWISDIIGEE